jgi:preprotein translocase subunit SecF
MHNIILKAGIAIRQFFCIGDYIRNQRKGILSALIFMDNVGCYGSEDKLIDCTYQTDTTEDEHINDIWITCNANEQATQATFDATEIVSSSESTSTTSVVALAVVVIVLGISILVIIFLIGYIVLRHKRQSLSSGM